MHIEFNLPKDSAGQAAAHYSRRLEASIGQWADENGIDYKLDNVRKEHNYYCVLTMFNESDFTLFGVSYNEPNLPRPVLVR